MASKNGIMMNSSWKRFVKSSQKILLTGTLSLTAFPLSSVYASFGVNAKNGNGFGSFRDIAANAPGQLLEHVRTYNSKSREICEHGQQGTYFGTKLLAEPDGSVTIFENCNGARTRFTPKGSVNLDAAVSKILAEVDKKSSSPMSDGLKKELSVKLKTDSELRREYAIRYGIKTDIADGSKLFTNSRGYQELERKGEFYIRKNSNGRNEKFSVATGRLVEVVVGGDYKVTLTYDKLGRLEKAADSTARNLSYAYRSDGRLISITSSNKQKVTYKYDNEGRMIESKDVKGDIYKYAWSGNNLSKIIYPDGKKISIDYEAKTQFVSKVTDKDGSWTRYVYGADSKNPDLHYWTEIITAQGKSGERKDRYEYKMRVNAEGVQKPHMIKTMVAGVETETIYAECCTSLPEKITQVVGGDKTITQFTYDQNGNLTSKINNKGLSTKIGYDPVHKKINQYEVNGRKTTFDYDKSGKLLKAVRDSLTILLTYDGKNISQMMSKDLKTKEQKVLSFKYDVEGNRPREISINGQSLKFIYGPNGATSVDNNVKPEVALEVSEAFAKLIGIVQPADFSIGV